MEETSMVRWTHTQAEALLCPVCSNTEGKEFVLQVRNPFPYSEWLDLYRCQACRSCFYYPVEVPQYDNDYGYKNYVKFYIEQGAGIDSMIQPIFQVANNGRFRSLLDIGCGFGFTVDFASRSLGWEAIGVEPSRYGQFGAEALGIKIYNDYIQNVSDLNGRLFDVVFSSEVIEHVPDPRLFIELVKRYVAKDGLLVLTTPNANYITPQAKYSTLLGTLSAGFHLIIFSPVGLKTILEQAGFPKVCVKEKAQALLAYAAMEDIRIDDDPRELNAAYCQYLENVMNASESHDVLYSGLGYRLFKERVNQGQFVDAEQVLGRLKDTLFKLYGPAVMVPDAIVSLAKEVKTFDEFGDRGPYNLSGLYYYMGMLNLNYGKNYSDASKLFRGGFQLGLKALSLGTALYEEVADLLWRMKLHEGLSYLYQEKRGEALDVFQYVLSNRRKKEEFYMIAPPAEVVIDALYQSGIAELQRGNLFQAIERFRVTIDEEQQIGTCRVINEAARHLGMAIAQLAASAAEKVRQVNAEANDLFMKEMKTTLNSIDLTTRSTIRTPSRFAIWRRPRH